MICVKLLIGEGVTNKKLLDGLLHAQRGQLLLHVVPVLPDLHRVVQVHSPIALTHSGNKLFPSK